MNDGRVCVVASYMAGLAVGVDNFPRPGETKVAHGFFPGPGGKGSNQAVQAVRLDTEVNLIAYTGMDTYGQEATALWERESISTEYARQIEDMTTGIAFIMVEDSGQNVIVVAPGANSLLDKNAIDAAASVFETSDVCLVQLEVPVGTAIHALRRAKEAGCTTIFNPAPAQLVPEETWKWVDIVTPNETEAEAVLGAEGTLEEVGWRLSEKVNQATIVTLGEEGALLINTNGDMERISAFKVRSTDTTGAGDAFNGALAARLAAGEHLREAVRWAMAAGALATTARGVIPALANTREIRALL